MKNSRKLVNKRPFKKILLREFYTSWWVFLVLILIGMLYVKTHQLKDEKIVKLANRLNELKAEKMLATLSKNQFLSEIESLDDPDYIEMLLIKKNGSYSRRFYKSAI